MKQPPDNSDEVTKLKKIIDEQSQKIAYLEKIIGLLPANVYWKNRDGYYLGCNESNLQITGYQSYQDIIGKKIHELVSQSYADEIRKVDEEIMASGVGRILEENWINFEGQPATYLTHKIPLFDENQNVTGLLGVSFDITERKKIELELKETKELAEEQSKITHVYLNNLVASLPENFYWVDKESRVLGCNENQAKILGLTSAQLTGKNVHDLAKILGWEERIADAIRENDLEVMKTRQSKKTEEVIVLNGEKRTFLSYKNPMVDDKNEVIGVFGIGIDITERKKMEEELLVAKEKAELANHAKSQFITNMSHDIRTPFSGILGFAKILQKKETDDKKKEMLGYIVQSSEKLLKLLNEILELAKTSHNNLLEEEKFNIREEVEKITEILLAEVKYKKLDFKVEFVEAVPLFLLGNKLKFERILLNLVSNAVKFTKNGYISVNVNISSYSQEGIVLQITVEDTGIGIPTDKYETIFEHFTRLTPAYRGNYPGSGLGLYMVKQYVTEMNGKISVESQLGKGSTFTCLLPFKVMNEKESISESSNIQNTILESFNFAINSQKYILLIEDDPIAQKISKIMLQEDFGCRVDLAKNGQRALEMVMINQYDLILMDIGLPDIDGFELANKIRTLGKGYAQIPIIGLTAHTDETSLSPNNSVMNIILIKPLSTEICVKLFSN